MKKGAFFIILLIVLVGCQPEILRPKGQPFSGYSCQESLMHFYSYCSKETLTKTDFETKVQTCEKALESESCDKEQAALLWCMGRVAPGTYTTGGGYIGQGVVIGGNGTISDGCDCSTYSGDLKKCRMKLGIFDN